ncbi:hypothetical protein CCAE64S_01435 [Castellaniella caeni]
MRRGPQQHFGNFPARNPAVDDPQIMNADPRLAPVIELDMKMWRQMIFRPDSNPAGREAFDNWHTAYARTVQ